MGNYLVYLIIYLSISNWIQIYFLLGNLLKPKNKLVSVNGKGLLSTINKKTGLNISIKLMEEKDKAIGFMISSPPFKPVMIFSQKLYELLNKDEFEWVALHELGHYLMWHNLKLALTQVLIGFIGLIALYSFQGKNILFVFLTAFILSLVFIQLAKIYEYQADYYSVTHMDNPEGMVTGNIKMKEANTYLDGSNSNILFKKLFIIACPYDQRIKMAQEELAKRKLLNE